LVRIIRLLLLLFARSSLTGFLNAGFIVLVTDAGLELLKQGLCWVYERYVGEASAEIQVRHQNAQETAQAQKAGLWQDPEPVPPWEWRKTEKERLEDGATTGFREAIATYTANGAWHGTIATLQFQRKDLRPLQFRDRTNLPALLRL
jgi:hypothetical protein